MPKAPTGKKLQPTGDVPGIASPNPRGQRKNAKVQSSTSQGVQPNPKGKTPRKPSKPAVYILGLTELDSVVGATGSGKTTFINRVSGSQLAVSDGLRSCTRTIQMGKPFIANGKIVTLVDTPGLDDTTVTEAAVLMQIAGFVSVLREQKKNLVGIIFLHSISDVRVGGTSRRNFDLFRKLSGEESLKNIAIATTMWGDVPKNLGLSHEKELKSDAVFYKPILTKGGKMFRYDDTPKSAKTVISYLVKKHPVSLLVQRELEQKKTITDTTVGAALQRNLGASQQRLNKELQDLRRDLAESKDPTSKSELGETVREMEQKLAALGKGGQLVQTLTQAKEAATVQLRESDGLVDILPDDSHGAACCIVM